jgi:hypothetical protein
MGAKSFILDAGLWRSSDSQEVRLVDWLETADWLALHYSARTLHKYTCIRFPSHLIFISFLRKVTYFFPTTSDHYMNRHSPAPVSAISIFMSV